MDVLTPLLAGLGPWGIAIGVGVTLLTQFLRNRVSPVNPAPTPAPAPAPVPQPAPAPSGTPILDALMNLLKLKLAATAAVGAEPVKADITHDDASDLLAKFFPRAGATGPALGK